jgi:hypothetical protein
LTACPRWIVVSIEPFLFNRARRRLDVTSCVQKITFVLPPVTSDVIVASGLESMSPGTASLGILPPQRSRTEGP